MTATPIWFGSDERPLFGFFHYPSDGAARAGVLICPPLGHEYEEAYSTLKLLAERLTEDGLCVLRMDYDGTGDSAGDQDDDGRARAWSASVEAGIALLRQSGAGPVVLVGMRMGAMLAGLAAERDGDIEGLVLWDPVSSGRAYVVEQLALMAFSSAPAGEAAAPTGPGEPGLAPAPATVNLGPGLPGLGFDSRAAADVRKLDLVKTSGPLAHRVLALTRADRGAGPLGARLDLPHVEWGEALGQADLMEAGSAYGVIAYAAIDRVARWVSDVAPTSRQALKPPPAAGSAVVGRTATGVPILETPVFLGNTGLFGILTEAPGRPPGPTAVFLSVANATHTGLDHLWVELARRWAASGFRCVRFDHSGLGDSPTRNERQPRFVSCAPEAFDDVAEVCAAVSPDDPANVVLVGFCTSGYQVLESALYLKPRGVVSFNPGLSFRPPETAKGGRVDPRRRIALPRRAFVGAYYANHYQGPAPAGVLHRYSNLGRVARAVAAPKARTARWLRDHQRDVVTNVTWRLRMLSSPDRRPARWMKELMDDGTEVFIVSSKGDARPLQVGVSKAQLEDWRRRGLHFVYISDHLLRVPSERASVTETVTAHMVHRFAEPAATAEAPSALAPSA